MGLFGSGKCKSKARLDDKTAVITGANTGIGYETAKDLLSRGCRVVLACRNIAKAEAAAVKLRAAVEGAQVRVVHLDLASLKSVKQCALEINQTEESINYLINNAGVMMCPYELTEDGFEMQFQSNHLGHFLLTNLLLDKIKQSAPSRIINVSSLAHKQGKVNFKDLQSTKKYSEIGAYGQSKLCNVLFTLQLQEMLKGSDVAAYAVHPGVVATELSRHMPSCIQWASTSAILKSPKQGAQTTLHCTVDEKLARQCGLYFSDCKETLSSKRARNRDDASRLWHVSEQLVHSFLI